MGAELKRYMRGVVGPFALRQGQGADTKPSRRGDGEASLGTREDKVEFADHREEMEHFRIEKKAVKNNTYVKKTVSKFLSKLFI